MTVLQDQTVRQVIHPSISGDELRVRLTNEFGEQPLAIAEARIAHRAGAGASTDTVPGTDRRLTFVGRSSALLPAGSPLISDPVRLRVAAGTSLVVSLYVQPRTPVHDAGRVLVPGHRHRGRQRHRRPPCDRRRPHCSSSNT